MTQLQDTLPLQIPIKGMNTRDPLASMSPEYSPWALNWEPESQNLAVRPGIQIHSSHPEWVIGLMNYRNIALFAYLDTGNGAPFAKIYNITNGASPSLVYTTGASGFVTVTRTFPFNGRMAFTTFNNAATESVEYDGSTWAPQGFNRTSNASLSFKGRNYFSYGSNLYYSGLAAITGALTTVSLTELFEESPAIYWMASLTSPTNNSSEQYLCFGNRMGEILVYAGDYPNAPNWERVAKFKTSKILNFSSCLEFNNDIFLLTETGVVSVRKLFQADPDIQENITISGPINPYWTSLISAAITTYGYSSALTRASMAYWPENNKLYILMDGFIEEDGTYLDFEEASTMFVYNVVTQAWTIQKLSNLESIYYGDSRHLTYFNNNLYFIAGYRVMKYVKNSFKDEDADNPGTYSAYPIELHSAYQNLNSNKKFKKVEGWDAVIKTDFAGSAVGVRSVADFGRKQSAVTNPGLVDGYNNPFYSVGVSGNYLQYRFEGNSDTASTDGFKLYSVGVSVK